MTDIQEYRDRKISEEATRILEGYGYTEDDQCWWFLHRAWKDRIMARKKAERMLDRLTEAGE